MKAFILIALLSVSLLSLQVRAECDEEGEEVSTWFKNVGCKIRRVSSDLGEKVKPVADSISEGAKDFGNSVAKKFDEVKRKLSEDSSESAPTPAPVYNAPTEKVPLAPLNGEPGAPPANIPAGAL